MQTFILAFLSSIKFKTDRSSLAFAAVLALVVGGLILHHDVDPKAGFAFLAAAYVLPGLFGGKPPPEDPPPPTLPSGTVAKAAAIISVAIMVIGALGCSGLGQTVDAVNQPKDDVVLAKCRQEMRSAVDAGSPPGAAYWTYYECTADGGLR